MKEITLDEREAAIVKSVSEWVKTKARWQSERMAGRFELCAPSEEEHKEELKQHLTSLWQEMSKVAQRVGFTPSAYNFLRSKPLDRGLKVETLKRPHLMIPIVFEYKRDFISNGKESEFMKDGSVFYFDENESGEIWITNTVVIYYLCVT